MKLNKEKPTKITPNKLKYCPFWAMLESGLFFFSKKSIATTEPASNSQALVGKRKNPAVGYALAVNCERAMPEKIPSPKIKVSFERQYLQTTHNINGKNI